jgi:Domain of unknown function DUF1828
MSTLCEILSQQMGKLYSCETVGEYIRVHTPFLYPDGDFIDLFYDEQQATLTDLGETVSWLKMQTVAQDLTKKQQQIITDICLTHNVEFYRGNLMVRIQQPQDLAEVFLRFTQAISRVSDIVFVVS